MRYKLEVYFRLEEFEMVKALVKREFGAILEPALLAGATGRQEPRQAS